MLKMTLRSTFASLFVMLLLAAPGFAQSLPSGWATADIGAVGATGAAASSGSGAFSLDGAGADVWGSVDAFRFAYTTLAGDGSIVTKVSSVERVNDWTKGGVMMRESLTTGSRHAFMLVSPGKGLAFQRRTATSGISTNTSGGSGTAPYFVKLTRTGTTFTAAKSVDGVTWTVVGTETISMASTIYVGVAVSSHVAGVLATTTFTNTAVSAGAAAAQPPPPTSSTQTTLRLLQWNTHHGGTGTDGRYDPARIASWIAKMNVDMASLNEVDSQDQVNAIVSNLQAATGKTWYISFSTIGNLLISRLPFANKSMCWYSTRYDGTGAYAAHGSVVINGRPVNVFVTHLSSTSATSRLAEVGAMHTCAANWAEARVIAGDHNMQYGSTEYMAAVNGYTDAWKAASAMGTATNYSGNCDGCTRNSRIDYVFTSNGATATLALKSAQMYDTRDASGVMPSDHKPMVVTYTVK